MRNGLAVLFSLFIVITYAQEACDLSLQSTEPSCPGDTDGSLTVVGAPGLYTYSWSHDGTLNGPTAIGLSSGTYNVVVTDTSGCVSFLEGLVNDPYVDPLGSFDVTDISCAGMSDGSITFNLDPGLTNSWEWTHDGNETSTTLSGLGVGGYGVVIQNPPECPSVIWAFLGDPDVEIAGQSQYCPSAPPLLTTQMQWGFQPDQFSWSIGGTSSSLQVEAGTEGLIELTATNSSTGCEATAEITLVQLPAPTVAFAAPDTMCQYLEFGVHVTESDADSLLWRWGGSNTSGLTDPVVSFGQAYWQQITLQGFFVPGCGSQPVQDSIYIEPLMPAHFSVEQIPCSPQVKIDLASGADSCAFFVRDSLIANVCDSTFLFNLRKYDVYDFSFFATQESGCNDQRTAELDVRTEPTLFMPNTFTPNGDGINDEWPGAIDITDTYELRVFDRAGNMIWITNSMDEKWNGEAYPSGMYIYTMRMRDPCEPVKEVSSTGHFMLMR